jgi:transcriptional regulator with XRE-family HTH domain
MKNLSEILSKYQQSNRLTQHQMANLLGVSQATYNNWLNHDKEINPKYLPIIAEVCSLELTTLIPHDANISITSKKYNY